MIKVLFRTALALTAAFIAAIGAPAAMAVGMVLGVAVMANRAPRPGNARPARVRGSAHRRPRPAAAR